MTNKTDIFAELVGLTSGTLGFVSDLIFLKEKRAAALPVSFGILKPLAATRKKNIIVFPAKFLGHERLCLDIAAAIALDFRMLKPCLLDARINLTITAELDMFEANSRKIFGQVKRSDFRILDPCEKVAASGVLFFVVDLLIAANVTLVIAFASRVLDRFTASAKNFLNFRVGRRSIQKFGLTELTFLDDTC